MKATHIVAIQSGWIFVGTLNEEASKGQLLVLDNAACVRQWGTEHGLGEIALAGPTPKTILDPCGTLEVNRVNHLFSLVCDQTKWV